MHVFQMPQAHYAVVFDGDDHQRWCAENWCHAMLRGGLFVETVDEEVVFHFDNVLDATSFRMQFRSQCGELQASREPFLPTL